MPIPSQTSKTTQTQTIKEAEAPSISLSLEEATLIKDGIESLQPDRKKTVVFDRLVMKIDRISMYWQNVEKAKAILKGQIAARFKK